MKCPICDSLSQDVYNTRSQPDLADQESPGIRVRYRRCQECGAKWRTHEVFDRLVALDGQSLRPERCREGAPGYHRPTPRTKLTPEDREALRGARGTPRIHTLAAELGINAKYAGRVSRGER